MTYSVYHVSPVYFFLITPALFLVFLLMNRLYSGKLLFYQAVEKIFFSCAYSIFFAVLLMFMGKVSEEVSRLYVGLLAVTSFLFLVAMRYVLKRTLGRTGLLRTPVLVVGAGLTADAVVNEFRKDSGLSYDVVGFLEDYEPKTQYVKDYPVLGGFDDLERVVAATGVQHVLIAAPGLPQKQLADLLYRAQSICSDVGVVPNLVEVPMSNVEVESYYDAKVMILHVQNNLAKPLNRAVKRVFDVVMTLVGGLLISPILLWVALWVYRDSPGPVIYKHRRVGRDGKEFDCYKFRSMCVDSAERPERAERRDEPRRPPAHHPERSAPVRRIHQRILHGAPRHHRHVAGERQKRHRLPRARPHGQLVRPQLVPLAGYPHALAYHQSRSRPKRGLLNEGIVCRSYMSQNVLQAVS